MSKSIFGSDRPLLYNVQPWAGLGFAVPNFSNNYGTLSTPIWGMASQIAKSQLFIMTHIDAQRTQAPSRNTVERVCKVVNRVHSVLGSRMKEYSDIRLEEGHATADMKSWQIHPIPFFPGPIVRNHWLAEYNQLTMIALTNIYQHSDNNLALTVTSQFARDIWKYFKEIKHLVGVELLQIPIESVAEDGFVFQPEHYDAYDPESVMLNFESLDSPGVLQSRATEDDIRPLFRGYPANEIISLLAEYPVDAAELGKQGQAVPDEAQVNGVADGRLVDTNPAGDIGRPQM